MEHLPYHVLHFSERVNLKPRQLDQHFDQHIERAASQKLERKCTSFGYVRPNSVILISRSLGYQKSCHFNGEMTFDVDLVADVCRPLRGDRIYCTVQNINRSGLLAKAGDDQELHIYIVIQHHNNATFFDDPRLKEQSHIMIEVIGSKAKLNDDKIIVIGKMIKIYDDLDLEDFIGKVVKLPIAQDSNFVWDLKTDDRPAQPKAYFGNENYVKAIKSILGKVQSEVKEEMLKSTMDDDDDVPAHDKSTPEVVTRKWQKACNLARSMTNEFELVHPPFSYLSDPPIRVYKPISRAFFKLWEIIRDFDLVHVKGRSKIVSAHLAESPGSFIEAVLKYREKGDSAPSTEDSNCKDECYVMSLKQSTSSSPGVPSASQIEALCNRYPNIKIVMGGEKSGHVPSGHSKRQGDGSGDILHIGNIQDFAADVQAVGGADFVTADLGFSFDDVEQEREQCMYLPILAQIIGILSSQKKNGNCVLKIFDTFTKVTVKLLNLLGCFYKELYITKPYTSRTGNPEKYVIGKSFRGIDKKTLSGLMSLFGQWRGIETHLGADFLQNSSYVVDIDNTKISQEMCEAVFKFNQVNVSQRQVRTISNMIQLLKTPVIEEDLRQSIISRQTRAARSWYHRYMSVASALASVSE